MRALRSLRLVVCAGVMAVAVFPVQAQELDPAERAEILQELEALVRDQRYDEARTLALDERFELEGDAAFDFLHGLAALETGHYSEAILALERVVAERPGFTRARFELARAQFAHDEDRRARANFERVLATQPPPPVELATQRYLRAIQSRADRYSTVFSGHVEAGLGTDSNVNSATDSDTLTIDFAGLALDVELDDAAQEIDDEFFRLEAQGRVSRPLTRGSTMFGQLSLEERRNFDEDDFDTRRLGARGGVVLHGEALQTELSMRYQQFRVGGDAFQNLFGLGANLRYPLSSRTTLMGGLQWSDLDYEERDERDSRLWLLSGGVSHVWSARFRPVGSASVFYGEESAQESGQAASAQADRDLYGVGAALGLTFTPRWQFVSRLQYRHSEYGADNPLFGETREDDFVQLQFDLHWQPAAGWRVGPHISFTDNDSNLELFEYDRQLYELRARYTF